MQIIFQSMKAANEEVTQYQVRKVFKELGLYKFEKNQGDDVHRCRYSARFVNQIWHSDVHYLKNMLYLYAIIDYRSMFIVGYGIIAEKTVECCKYLKDAIDKYGKLAIMWTDNGGENTGDDMKDFLKENRIYPVLIKPHNPQQNGKIEAFWKKLEDFISDKREIPRYIEVYNRMKVHTGIERKSNGTYKRPCDVFFDQALRWQRDYPWKWIVDGKEVDFKVDLQRKAEYYD